MVNEVMDVWQIYLISKTIRKNVVFISIIDYDGGLFIYSMVCGMNITEWAHNCKENSDIIKCVVKTITFNVSCIVH